MDITGLSVSAHRSRLGATRAWAFRLIRRVGGRRPTALAAEATERTFLVAAVAAITQVFATVCRSDSLN